MSSENKKTPAKPPNPENFTFIVSTGSSLSVTPEDRSIIRKQAMKKAGNARKARGNYGKVNMIQYPTNVLPPPPMMALENTTLEAKEEASYETRQHDQLAEDSGNEATQQLATHATELSVPLEDYTDSLNQVCSPSHNIPMDSYLSPADGHQHSFEMYHLRTTHASYCSAPAPSYVENHSEDEETPYNFRTS